MFYFLDFIGAKDDGGGGNNWGYSLQDVQSSSQIVTTNKPTPSFYQPDALPVTQSCQSTEGKWPVIYWQ